MEFYDKGIFYIETDLPGVVKIKKAILREMSADKKVKIFPLNVLDRKALFKIGEFYKKSNTKKPLAIVHSGLWTYLNKNEQKIMTENIQKFLKRYSPKGYWISSDFRPKSLQKNIFFKYLRKSITKKTERKPTRFKNEKELSEFMKTQGFNTKIFLNPEVLKNMRTPNKFKLKEEDVLKQSQDFKVYVMTLSE